jgi:hypothetical protein
LPAMTLTNGQIVLAALRELQQRRLGKGNERPHPGFVWINDADTAGVMGTPVELHGPAERACGR